MIPVAAQAAIEWSDVAPKPVSWLCVFPGRRVVHVAPAGQILCGRRVVRGPTLLESRPDAHTMGGTLGGRRLCRTCESVIVHRYGDRPRRLMPLSPADVACHLAASADEADVDRILLAAMSQLRPAALGKVFVTPTGSKTSLYPLVHKWRAWHRDTPAREARTEAGDLYAATRTGEPEPEATAPIVSTSPPGFPALSTGPDLADVEKCALLFAGWAFASPGRREAAIRDLFAIGATRYYQWLLALCGDVRAHAYAPITARRVHNGRRVA